MAEIKIDKEFKALLDPLTTEEYKLLEQSILDEGCREPIIIWDNIIIDGHNRYEICQKHNKPFNVIPSIEFESRDQAKLWILDNQASRRNLSKYAKGVNALKKKDIISKMARENQLSALKQYQDNTDLANLPKRSINTRELLAKEAGISGRTLDKIEKIEEFASDDIKQNIRDGNVSIEKVYNQLTHKEPKQITQPKPKDKGTEDKEPQDRGQVAHIPKPDIQAQEQEPNGSYADMFKMITLFKLIGAYRASFYEEKGYLEGVFDIQGKLRSSIYLIYGDDMGIDKGIYINTYDNIPQCEDFVTYTKEGNLTFKIFDGKLDDNASIVKLIKLKEPISDIEPQEDKEPDRAPQPEPQEQSSEPEKKISKREANKLEYIAKIKAGIAQCKAEGVELSTREIAQRAGVDQATVSRYHSKYNLVDY